MERVLIKFADFADQDRNQIERDEKALADYRAQADRRFEHEAKLRELIARQAQLNATLALDKSISRPLRLRMSKLPNANRPV
jgi:hypothetical protein